MKEKIIGNLITTGCGKQQLNNSIESKKDNIDYVLKNYYYHNIYKNIQITDEKSKILNKYIQIFQQNKILCNNNDLKQLQFELKIKNINITTNQIAKLIVKEKFLQQFKNNYKTNQIKKQININQLSYSNVDKIKKIYIHPIFWRKNQQLFQQLKIPFRQFFLTYNNIPCLFDKTINPEKICIVYKD